MNEHDKKELAKLLREHRRCRIHYEGRKEVIACLCGERLRSNSHFATSEHQAEVVANWLSERGN